MPRIVTADEEVVPHSFHLLHNTAGVRPVLVTNHEEGHLFLARPILGPLLFDNLDSDARDHCACERTFLSWLRLSIFMAIVAVAIVLSFHLKREPTAIERRMALPLGLVFWLLALSCLVLGFANYIRTVTRYSRRQALVQSGWKTQAVSTVVAAAIIATCILFLVTSSEQSR
ncbi:MAG: hypothetical protein M1832_005285 [Thelocarpon impressellum]|nr:MAG: hypothetical protein M1832_005285 [Thelocarpon impressellum]